MSIKNCATGPRLPDTLLDLGQFVPFYIGSIANKWTASSSKLYLASFGFGITEWRVLGILGSKEFGRDESGASSNKMAFHLGADTGAVCRAVTNLEKKQLIERVPGRFVGRTKPYRMTNAGVEVFDQVRQVALQRQNVLLADLDPAERQTLLNLLRKVHGRLGDISGA